MRIAGKIAAGIVIVMVVVAVATLLNTEFLLNRFVRERIIREVNREQGTSLALGAFHYDLFANRIRCDSVRLTSRRHDSDSSGIQLAMDELSFSDIDWLRLLARNGFSCGDLVLEGLRGHIIVPKHEEDSAHTPAATAGKRENRGTIERLLPISIGRLSVRSRSLTRITLSNDGISRDSVSRAALDFRHVHVESLSANQIESTLAQAEIEGEVREGVYRIPRSPYNVAFASARVSHAESTVQIDSFQISPLKNDADFFARERRATTRYRASFDRISVHGVDLPGLIRGKQYVARLITVRRPVINILINKETSVPSADSAKMPNEILTRMDDKLRIDSLVVSGGTLVYAERYSYSSRPAVLRWSDVRLTVSGISNQKSDVDTTTGIQASGMFQDTARMVVFMALPLAKRDFSLSCRGTLDSLPLPSLNSFLEVSDRIRILSGRADSIKFSLSSAKGQSSGTVRPRYQDLKIELLDKHSGSSAPLPQKVGTFLANTFKIRKDNVPDASDGIKEGPVQYTRKPGDPFFRFVWFSLRGGLGKVVGF